MRERLVELLEKFKYKCLISCKDGFFDSAKDCDECVEKQLADYLIASGVVVPPCKVGDVCYPLDASEKQLTCEETISRITISERNVIIGYYEHWDYYNKCRKTDTWRLPLRTRILGKGVFLTREEAEAKLKGEAK